jgi:hypothetical protein
MSSSHASCIDAGLDLQKAALTSLEDRSQFGRALSLIAPPAPSLGQHGAFAGRLLGVFDSRRHPTTALIRDGQFEACSGLDRAVFHPNCGRLLLPG